MAELKNRQRNKGRRNLWAPENKPDDFDSMGDDFLMPPDFPSTTRPIDRWMDGWMAEVAVIANIPQLSNNEVTEPCYVFSSISQP